MSPLYDFGICETAFADVLLYYLKVECVIISYPLCDNQLSIFLDDNSLHCITIQLYKLDGNTYKLCWFK